MLTPELLEARRGTITASEAHSIMAGWDAPRPTDEFPSELYDLLAKLEKKPLVSAVKKFVDCEVSGKLIDAAWKAVAYDRPSQGLLTYAEKLACDELFDPDPMLYDGSNNPHMINGNDREIEAVELLIDETGLPFDKTGDDQIHISVGGIGATPDGIMYDDMDLIVTGCEIKCRSPLHHARQLLINDNKTLREHDFDRYAQIQVAIEVTGADDWYSVSYNPYAKSGLHRFHYCVIQRDELFINVFNKRAAMVFKHKAAFLNQLNEIRGRSAA